MQNHLTRMFRYVAWANLRTLGAVRANPAVHDQTLPVLAHLLAAEQIWLARLELRDPIHAVWPNLQLAECEALAAENAAGYASFLARLTTDQITQTVAYRNSQGTLFLTPVIDILTQVLTHGPYHRGQVAKMIGQSGGTAVNTDYITFVRETAAH